jgi:hypothetical protein
VYDFCQSRYEARHERVGSAEYWCIDLATNADRIVRLEQGSLPVGPQQPPLVICVFHDIEENIDSDADPEECQGVLRRMLDVEREHGVKTTYNILGQLFERNAPLIAQSADHSIAFHTYNHRLDSLDQLQQVRGVDLQVKGYRTGRSIITKELTDYALSFHNFEWLMSSARSFGFDLPRLENGIVKIPAHLDDYLLSSGELNYAEWMNRLITMTKEQPFVSLGLHDCYSRFWIERYSELLDRLKRVGELWTCDQITNQVYFMDASAAAAEMRLAR